MKNVLFPQCLTDKIDTITKKIEELSKRIEAREAKIVENEHRVSELESDLDGLWQYSRRGNLLFHGVDGSESGEDTEINIIDIINDKIAPPPACGD